MGRTIPSYRIATEIERNKWKPFRLMLSRKDRNLPRYYNSAGMRAARPIVFHSVLVAILLHHYKQLQEMVKRVNGEVAADKLNRCPKCKSGILETTRNYKISVCDNCGWAKIEMTMADYEEMFKQQKIGCQQDLRLA
jgi:uncharacterized protein with PIN domain